MPKKRIAESYGSPIFSFLMNLHTLLPSGCTSYIPTKSVGEIHFLYTLSSIYYL